MVYICASPHFSIYFLFPKVFPEHCMRTSVLICVLFQQNTQFLDALGHKIRVNIGLKICVFSVVIFKNLQQLTLFICVQKMKGHKFDRQSATEQGMQPYHATNVTSLCKLAAAKWLHYKCSCYHSFVKRCLPWLYRLVCRVLKHPAVCIREYSAQTLLINRHV